MIIAPDWIWLHFPKCAGTTTATILKAAFGDRPEVRFDPVGPGLPVIWHQNIAARKDSDPAFEPGNRSVVANIRRLPHWIISRVLYEVQRSGEGAAPARADFVKGVFKHPKQPGKVGDDSPQYAIGRAEQVMQRFQPEVTHWIRTETLLEDLARFFALPPDHPALTTKPRNETKISTIKTLDFWFTARDLAELYDANPTWAAVEARVYGNILTL